MYLSTYTGHCIELAKMTAADIKILDIAHALSNQCRFGGHTTKFYSVAQHSVRVALALPKDLRLAGLLHDAQEAYLIDLPRPIKQLLPDYRAMEGHVWSIIAEKYGLPEQLPDAVKRADEMALLAEFREVMTFQPPESWFPGLRPLAPACRQWSPEEAREVFLSVFTAAIPDAALEGTKF